MKKVSKAALIRAELAEGMSVKDIATLLDIREDYVAQVKWHWQGGKKKKKSKKKPSKILKVVKEADEIFTGYTKEKVGKASAVWAEKALKIDSVNFGEPSEAAKTWLEDYTKKVNALLDEAIVETAAPVDAVNSPAHYTAGGIETIDFIEAKKLGYNLGNCVKYLSRADHKGKRLEDLQKAAWYLQREIEAAQS